MDESIRLAAFNWLKEQTDIYGDVLPRKLLATGFNYFGERVTLVGPKGIWKPKNMKLPISITTVLDGRYSDSTTGGLLNYKYRGTDPYHPDNTGLRYLMTNNIPLIFFHNIFKGKYMVTFPVYILKDNLQDLSFTVAVDDISTLHTEKSNIIEAPEADYSRRAYLTATVRQRVHQRSFRERVLHAYQDQCTLCRLRHRELLDAAHIIPDSEESGEPIVQNGLSLCKIHHAAFDNNILGITPDYIIKVREDILQEIDGPMLKYGLQSLENNHLILPSNKKFWPDKDRLEIRYSRFLKAG